jgi:hypothetical protein
LEPGPVGEYIEVVDVDPASGVIYLPVDLNDPRLLAQDGHAPSEANPQSHQQMTYAVAMATIAHFERALGRAVLWSDYRPDSQSRHFVRRLRIYPHALRERNAYYSPAKKALLFGYFPVDRKDRHNTPGTIVHTALSHDIIAHEVTHALLDGIHPRFNEPFNVDVLAFHEAFADIVALFQHFSYPGVLREQMARTRGNLETENALGQLAQQFGRAAGRGGSLRDALGEFDPETNAWRLRSPDPTALERTDEPHDRGSILVAAVFGAFITVYKKRTRDLYRIASDGTGILKAGDIHPDLSGRLADEATRCAQRMLQMCIRALDYAPPVGITFGDYLRALVTADHDLLPEDPAGYRVAVVESFRRWGIYPAGMRSMSVESLLWPSAEDLATAEATREVTLYAEKALRLRDTEASLQRQYSKQRPMSQTSESIQRSMLSETGEVLDPAALQLPDRLAIWRGAQEQAKAFWHWLNDEDETLLRAIGIVLTPRQRKLSIFERHGRYRTEIHSVRIANREGQNGWPASEMVVEITQRRRGYLDPAEQAAVDDGRKFVGENDKGDFRYRAGCTLLVDPETMRLRRVIRTGGTIDDDVALGKVRAFLSGERLSPGNAFEAASAAISRAEPFAMLHRGGH